jgi:hypothetical protein
MNLFQSKFASSLQNVLHNFYNKLHDFAHKTGLLIHITLQFTRIYSIEFQQLLISIFCLYAKG